MAQTISFQVAGLAELEARLQLLDDIVQRQSLRLALRDAGRVFLAAMKALVRRSGSQPVHASTGKTRPHLVDDLRVRFRVVRGLLTALVGVGRRTAYIANFLEFGTAPHVIEAKQGKPLAVPGATHPVFRVEHPGAAARPLIRPAFDTEYLNVIEKFRDVLAERINRAFKR